MALILKSISRIALLALLLVIGGRKAAATSPDYYGGVVSTPAPTPIVYPDFEIADVTVTGPIIDTPFPPVFPPPPNDLFANAIRLTGATNEIAVSNRGATTEAGEPTYPNEPGGASIWYAWKIPATAKSTVSLARWTPNYAAPSAYAITPARSEESIFYPWGGISWSGGDGNVGSVTITTGDPGSWIWLGPIDVQPTFHPILAVYRGSSLDHLQLVGRGVDAIIFDAIAGETVYIAMEGYCGLFGNATVCTTQVPAPRNDNFSAALGIENAGKGIFSGNVVSASRESGEPSAGAEFGGASVWFKWKAAMYGTVSLIAQLSSAYSMLPVAVFTGNSFSNLQCIASASDRPVNFFGEEGTEYYVAVYRGSSTATEEFQIDVSGPTYREYETTFDALMPVGLVPRFYGIRGVTALLYAKTADGWRSVEVEPIGGEAAVMTERPADAVEGKLRVLTIDESLPAPRVELTRGALNPVLRGIPGQQCFISYSRDLVNWSGYERIRLTEREKVLRPRDGDGEGMFFYRVTQEWPQTPIGVGTVTVQVQAP